MKFHAVLVNTGGFEKEEFKKYRGKGRKSWGCFLKGFGCYLKPTTMK